MEKIVNSILKLRRDNDYNYQKIGNKFIPEKGEVCLVDTSNKGLCAVVGDGQTSFNELEYVNTIFEIVKFINNKIYDINDNSIELKPNSNKLYIDVDNVNDLYYYNGIDFIIINSQIPKASSETAGILKLYETTGQNTDGTMTQKAITDELKHKISASVNLENETVIFI
jgi:hypothetical protein